MTGIIKTLNEKGFGFISCEGQAKDTFFHSNSLVGVTFEELQTKQRNGEEIKVSFELTQTEKGPAATNVAIA